MAEGLPNYDNLTILKREAFARMVESRRIVIDLCRTNVNITKMAYLKYKHGGKSRALLGGTNR